MGVIEKNNNMLSSNELNSLFSELGADSTLARIKVYVEYRCNYLRSRQNIILDNDSKTKLNYYISHLEPDLFFDTYFPDYFERAKPFSWLCSFFSSTYLDMNNQSRLLALFYLLLYIKERYPNECLFFQYQKLQAYSNMTIVPSYITFCYIWRGFFVLPYLRTLFPDFDFCKIDEALLRLGLYSTYYRSLIILYVVLYRDFRKCERQQKTIEKLRDEFDWIEKFESPQAIFTYKNFDESKPRFLNKLFENTVPQNFKNSDQGNWKLDFSVVLNAFCGCSLDFLIYYLIPEAFSSISAVISYLKNFQSRKNHSSDRKVIEIICAYLFSIESVEYDKVKTFKNYLENTIFRDPLSNYDQIYDKLNKLQTTYAVIEYRSENKYKKVYEKAKPTLINSTKSKGVDKAMLDYYTDSHDNLVTDTKNLCNIPALNFLIENNDNYKDSMVENGIIFEETANSVMFSSLRNVVLLQPSYTFLLRWLSDYRTKNLETTIVIYNKDIVDCLNKKLNDHNLISKELYYSNQDTSYSLHIVNSTDSISEFDLALSFYNKTSPKYEDLVRLSKLLSGQNKLLCVLPNKFFETDENGTIRQEIISSTRVKKVTYIASVLFAYNPKKKYLVEFGKRNESNQNSIILIRSFEINKSIHGEKNNHIKSDSGLFFLNSPTEVRLQLDRPYDGETIGFLEATAKQINSHEKIKYNKAQQVSFAPDFKVYYTVTNHGKGRQAKCFFAKYLPPSKKHSSKKDYGAKIDRSRVTISAKDDVDLEKKIIADFLFSDRFEKFREEAAKEIKLALKQGRLTNISLFSFSFSYADAIKNYASIFDDSFCFHAFDRTALGSLKLNEATQEDFERAISELIASVKIDSEKLYRQLEIVLNCAVKYSVLFNSRTPVFAYIETRKKQLQTKAQLREAFTKKTLTYEEEKSLISWLIKQIPQKPAYLGTMIKLLTGMTNPEVSMLTWGDFCKTEYSDYYHLKVTKQRNYKSLKEEDLSSPFKYRIVPIPIFLSNLIIAQRDRLQKRFKISFANLMALPLITDSSESPIDYCSPNKLRLNSNRALKKGALIPEYLVSYPESDGTEEHDLSRYNGDFFASNFKYHALNDAMMTQGEVSYILGLVPRDTFSKHYCDYTNPFLQIKLVEKLNDWCSIYFDWEGTPQMKTGTTKSELKGRNIFINPYNSGCASGQLQLSVKDKCSSAIEITVAGDRGISGTATIYKENKHAK